MEQIQPSHIESCFCKLLFIGKGLVVTTCLYWGWGGGDEGGGMRKDV